MRSHSKQWRKPNLNVLPYPIKIFQPLSALHQANGYQPPNNAGLLQQIKARVAQCPEREDYVAKTVMKFQTSTGINLAEFIDILRLFGIRLTAEENERIFYHFGNTSHRLPLYALMCILFGEEKAAKRWTALCGGKGKGQLAMPSTVIDAMTVPIPVVGRRSGRTNSTRHTTGRDGAASACTVRAGGMSRLDEVAKLLQARIIQFTGACGFEQRLKKAWEVFLTAAGRPARGSYGAFPKVEGGNFSRISRSGFVNAVMKLEIPCDPEEAALLFDSVDADQDGFINIKEWRHVAFQARGGLPSVTKSRIAEMEAQSGTIPQPGMRLESQTREKRGVANRSKSAMLVGPQPEWWGGKGQYAQGRLYPSDYLRPEADHLAPTLPITDGCTYNHRVLERRRKGVDLEFYQSDKPAPCTLPTYTNKDYFVLHNEERTN